MLRSAYNALRRTPGYALACIAVLALGIGANTAIFSLVYTVVLQPLPYPESDRLVMLWEGFPNMPAPLNDHLAVHRLAYEAWKLETQSFTSIGAFHETRLSEGGLDRPRVITTEQVSANLLPLLGAQARVGRLFRADEETPTADRVAMISEAYFEKRLASDPAALGKTLTLSGTDYTVIGVLPRRFRLPATFGGENRSDPDVFIPLSRLWTRPELDNQTFLSVAG
ncbi:MAG: ABC transporter permease, partial [Acidobacteriota bacterium]